MNTQNKNLYKMLIDLKYFYIDADRFLGLCECIKIMPNYNKVEKQKLQNELNKRATRKGINDGYCYWWPIQDFESRIEFLQELIDEYK